jgi:hypothetical protein
LEGPDHNCGMEAWADTQGHGDAGAGFKFVQGRTGTLPDFGAYPGRRLRGGGIFSDGLQAAV